MRLALLAFAVSLAAGAAAAQDAPADKPDPRKNQKIERIRHEDHSNRIDELRVGGETQSITVQPKQSPLPAYEVRPRDGTRLWNVLGF